MKKLIIVLLLSSCAAKRPAAVFADNSEHTAKLWVCGYHEEVFRCIAYERFSAYLRATEAEHQAEITTEL